MFDFTKDPVCNIATNLLRLAEKKPNGPFDIQVPEQRNKEPNSHQSEMPSCPTSRQRVINVHGRKRRRRRRIK